MPPAAALAALMRDLDAVRAGRLDSNSVVKTLRDAHELAAALTPRHGQALDEILTRLESGSLFSEESCSFSQHDLHDALEAWLTHAAAHLARPAQAA